jgi:LysM repeat protein
MNDVRQVVLGVLAALLSSAILLGSLALSLAEGGQLVALLPSSTATLVVTVTNTPTLPPPPTTRPGEPTYTPSPTPLPTATPTDTSTPTPFPTSPRCPQPDDWKSIIAPLGATVYSLADAYDVPPKIMAEYNCLPLSSSPLPANSTVYVPKRTPTPTATKVTCGPFPGWVKGYTIQPGDTLYRLSLIFRVSVEDLQIANCLGNSTQIHAGERFWVPFVPPVVPSRTPVRTPTPVAQPTHTPTNPPTATSQPTNTPRPTATSTSLPGPTRTPTRIPQPTDNPTDSPTPAPSDTPIPSDTPVPPATNTPVPSDTPLPPNTPVPTDTPQPKNTLPSPIQTPPPGMALAPV